MGFEHHVRLFRHGSSQAVDIPREFELPGEAAVMRKDGDRIIIEAVMPDEPRQSFVEWLRTLEPIDEKLGEIEDSPPEPFEL